MSTNPDEFARFHELLTQDRPDYTPHYFRLRKGDKDPDVRGSWKKCRLTFEEAYEEMKRGFNIGIAGTDKDGLVVVDLDRPGVVDVKPTLRVKSRKRQGWHNFYFSTDQKCKKNIPTEESGEVRPVWQYVVAAGSFVALDEEKIDKLPKPEQALAGAYTLENPVPPVSLLFDELPALFRMQIHEREQPTAPRSKRKVNFKSGLWQLTGRDIFNDAPPPHVRWTSPFHDSETGQNTSMSDHGLIHCWRHNVSLTAIQALSVLAGFASCMDAGHGHSGSGAGASKLDLKDKEMVRKIWSYAKDEGFLPQDDPDPLTLYASDGWKEPMAYFDVGTVKKRTGEEVQSYKFLWGAFAKDLMACEKFRRVVPRGDMLYYWRDGIYLPKGEQFIIRRLAEVLADYAVHVSRNTRAELVDSIRAQSIHMDEPEDDTDLIPFKNGVYNWTDGTFRPFDIETDIFYSKLALSVYEFCVLHIIRRTINRYYKYQVPTERQPPRHVSKSAFIAFRPWLQWSHGRSSMDTASEQ